jgi:toxin-antitoxin system PIN domain toxin
MKFYFPDVNVWVALAYSRHVHHRSAAFWFNSLEGEIAYFCRITQLGFLRLMTQPAVMGSDTKTPTEAWGIYDLILSDERVSFRAEPESVLLESDFRRLTTKPQFSSKDWPDAYLATFAETADVILVTFDRALHQMNGGKSLLLN